MPPHEDTVPFRVLAYLSSDCSHRCSGAWRRSVTDHASTTFTRCEEGCQIEGARGQAKHDRRAPTSERGVHRQIPELLDKHPVLAWREAGIEGFRLRPGAVPADLKGIARGLTAALRRRGAFRHAYESATLRGLLGLPRPANRYATASGRLP